MKGVAPALQKTGQTSFVCPDASTSGVWRKLTVKLGSSSYAGPRNRWPTHRISGRLLRNRESNQRRNAPDVQFLVNTPTIRFNGFGRDVKHCPNFSTGEPINGEAYDIELSRGQAGRWGAPCASDENTLRERIRKIVPTRAHPADRVGNTRERGALYQESIGTQIDCGQTAIFLGRSRQDDHFRARL